MGLISYKNGQTGVVLRLKILDSSVTTGAGLTGLTNSSSGLVIAAIADTEAASTAYTSAGSTVDTVTTLGTYAAPTSTHCRFKEVDATNHKGVYELQFENARFAVSGAKSLLVSVAGATNAVQTDVVIPLTAADPYAAPQAFPANFPSLGITGGGKVSGVALVDALTAYSGNTAQTGDAFAALAPFSGTALTGTVGTVTDNGHFTVTFNTPYDGNGTTLGDGTIPFSFTSGLNHLKFQYISSGTVLTDSTHASIVLAGAMPYTVATGNTFVLLTN